MSKASVSRRSFLKTCGVVTAGLASVGMAGAAPEKKPNILMILVDDLGYGDLSSYSAPDMQTPHIDKLMSQGMRFNQFYANCPVCSPTRAALLSGRYPDMVGVPGVIRTHETDSWGLLKRDAVLLPTVLKRADYHTAIIGKWHLGLTEPDQPTRRGFDFFKGFLGDMMDDYYTHRRFGNNYMRENETEIDPKGHATDLFSEWANDYLTLRKSKQQPFFLYLAYNAPHTPIQPPPEWVERVMKRQPDVDPKRAKLIALIEHLDDGIGKVLATLEKTGQTNETFVIFSSDNGGQVSAGARNAPWSGGKQQMQEGGIRVATCAVWPGNIEPGTTSERVAATIDLYPTICEAAGAKFDHEIDGRTILPTLLGKAQPNEDRTIFWVRLEGGNQYGGRAYYAARRGPWKLQHDTPFEPMKLYNLDDDPKEENPLPANHKMYRQLFQELQNHISRAGAIPWHE